MRLCGHDSGRIRVAAAELICDLAFGSPRNQRLIADREVQRSDGFEFGKVRRGWRWSGFIAFSPLFVASIPDSPSHHYYYFCCCCGCLTSALALRPFCLRAAASTTFCVARPSRGKSSRR